MVCRSVNFTRLGAGQPPASERLGEIWSRDQITNIKIFTHALCDKSPNRIVLVITHTPFTTDVKLQEVYYINIHHLAD